MMAQVGIYLKKKFRLGFLCVSVVSVGIGDNNCVLHNGTYHNIMQIQCALLKPNHATLVLLIIFNSASLIPLNSIVAPIMSLV